jgi:hypothetical protein
MPGKSPYTWRPEDVVEVTNTTSENFLLELDSGQLRLDAGRTIRLTGSALEQHQLVALMNAGKIKAEKFNWRKRTDAKR